MPTCRGGQVAGYKLCFSPPQWKSATFLIRQMSDTWQNCHQDSPTVVILTIFSPCSCTDTFAMSQKTTQFWCLVSWNGFSCEGLFHCFLLRGILNAGLCIVPEQFFCSMVGWILSWWGRLLLWSSAISMAWCASSAAMFGCVVHILVTFTWMLAPKVSSLFLSQWLPTHCSEF